jgi:hypothetical protein
MAASAVAMWPCGRKLKFGSTDSPIGQLADTKTRLQQHNQAGRLCQYLYQPPVWGHRIAVINVRCLFTLVLPSVLFHCAVHHDTAH